MNVKPLSELDGRKIGRFATRMTRTGAGRTSDEHRFTLELLDDEGRSAAPPAITGLYFEGRGKWYRPWFEVRYENLLEFGGGSMDLTGTGEEEGIFKLLCDQLPPGSHIMVPYRTHRITAMALIFLVPPAASPIGYLLYLGGCRWYKDWYFAEGFLEGEEKLQASKPLDEARKREKTAVIKRELKQYLEREPDPSKMEMEEICRGLASRILEGDE